MSNKLNLIINNKIFWGVECVSIDDSKFSFNLVCIEKIKEQFKIRNEVYGLTDATELFKLIPNGSAVAVAFSGNGAIHKKIFVSEHDNESTILNQVLPNAKIYDFFIQKYPCIDQSIMVSIIRNTMIEEINNLFKENQVSVVSFGIGPVYLPEFLIFLSVALVNNQINLPNYHIELTSNGIIEFTAGQFPEEILHLKESEETISSQNLIAFSSAFSLTGLLESKYVQPLLITNNKIEFEQNNLHKKIIAYSLSIAFILLFVNFFLLMNLTKKKDLLETSVSLNESSIQKFKKADEDLKNIKKLINQSGLTGTTSMAFYGDQLGKSIPTQITLKELSIQPALKDYNNEDSISFIPKTMIVSGKCEKAEDFSQWITKLKLLDWIKDISLEDFKKNSENDDQEFKLTIKL